MMKYYLAIDIGASSGRHIVGWREHGVLCTKEVYRFANGVRTAGGHLTWDLEHIYEQVKRGIRAAFAEFGSLESLSIDTWGVDYVLLKDGAPFSPCYAYRDSRTADAVPQVHAKIPFGDLYSRTGIQFQSFNTVYQLYQDQLSGRLEQATDFLMIPEYLMWRLCGVMAKEYTNATTTGLVELKSGEYDPGIIRTLGFPPALFKKLSPPGTVLGPLKPEVSAELGGQCSVMLCATHDTASAVEGIPMETDAPFLSSGTWSLLGVKLKSPLAGEDSRRANFTNEGGVGYIRYLKNIMGLWIIQGLQKQMDLSFSDMVRLAQTSSFTEIFDVNDSRFSAPADMRGAVLSTLETKPAADGDLINSVYHSLAYSYGQAIRELEQLSGRRWDRLYIVGGGAKNQYLNGLTETYTGKKVVALPIEATALGNLKIQMEGN